LSQSAELKRVYGLLKGEYAKTGDTTQKLKLVEDWTVLQAETPNDRAQYLAWAAKVTEKGAPKTADQLAADADKLAHALDRRFFAVAPKLIDTPESALAPDRWRELGDNKPAAAPTDGERRLRTAHLLIHLDREAGWQKRVAVVVGLRKYVQAVTHQADRFREMRLQAELPIGFDQAAFERTQQLQIAQARDADDRARKVAAERALLDETLQAQEDAVARRVSQLNNLKAQLAKVTNEVNSLLVEQSGIEKELYAVQREVALTLEDVYRLEALLTEVERQRYAVTPGK
ncbi:MAG: hypothetical protein K2V38_27055, partial [Gemmataceae bacterium]|nr:hypothetical protein [Gemmataceae bacterium]